jgi:RNA polymerase sigma-70 factor (ECF subfamily)
MPPRSYSPPVDGTTRTQQFEALMRPQIPQLYRAAYRLLGNRDDAEDLVQEVLIKLFPRTPEMLELRDLRQWLLRVLYHQFVDFTRQRDRRPRTVFDEQTMEGAMDPGAGPDQELAQADSVARIAAALAELPQDHRALVTLHMLEGYTLEELTGVFDVPLGTLKSRLHRAKATLRARLAEGPAPGNLFR